ncbi:MAG TPA: ABC transporter permease [Vicinamibacterales bacterium]|nr:ABC transporter permease [Vicinamibacterales bacterium]
MSPSDLRFAARQLRKSPSFTFVAVTSLALAIGANTTIFSLGKQLLFERLHVPSASSLRLLTSTDAGFSYPIYEQLREQNQVLGDLVAFRTTAVNMTVGEHAERVRLQEVSGNYYRVLGVQPQLGRGIGPADDSAGSEPVVVIIGASLFMRSLTGLTAVNPGFRTDHLLLAQIVLPQNRYPAGANVAFHQRLERAIATIPGVTSVSAAEAPYLSGEQLQTTVVPHGEANANADQTEPYNAVGLHFFETLGIPIVAGRAFGADETAISPKVAVINRRLAATRFPNQNPIGKRVSLGVYAGYGAILTAAPVEIVGVAGDSLYADLHGAAPPQLFVPYVQQTQVRRLTYLIRTQTKPEAAVPALRRVVHAADPALPLVNIRTQQEQIDSDLADERLLVSLTSGFGLLALVLASVGIYGLMAYSVAQRTREIGIRMTVGAIPRQILAMVLREASSLSAVAIALGVGASLLVARFVESMLFGVAPSDPATLWGAATLLLIVALGASWIPARRAASVQAMEALRHD